MPITYIRLKRTDDQVHDEGMLRGEGPCEPEEQEEAPPPMPRTSPIRVWELLRPGEPLEAAELARQADVSRRQLRRSVGSLRRRGQRVVYDATTATTGTYQFFPSPPLLVVENTRGLHLAREDGSSPGKGEILHELG